MATTNKATMLFRAVPSSAIEEPLSYHDTRTNNQTTEEKIKDLAKFTYGKDSESLIRESLLEIGKGKKAAETQLKIYNENIEKLKREDNIKRAEVEEAAKLYDKIRNSEDIVNDIVNTFNNNINKLIESIEKNDHFYVSVMIKTVDGNFRDYKANLKKLGQNIKDYNDFIAENHTLKKEKYSSTHSKINLTEEQIEKIYRGLKQHIKSLESNKKKYIASYQGCLKNLESYCGDKTLFEKIALRVDAELEKAETNPNEKVFKDAQTEIDAKVAELFEQYKKEFKELNKTINNFEVEVYNEIVSILEKYDALTEDEKEQLAENGIEKFNSKINSEYSKELLAAVKEASIIKGLITELSKIEYTDPIFNQKFSELEERLNSTTTSEIFKNAVEAIIYDKTNLKLHIIFRIEDLSKVNNLSIDVVPESIKAIVKGKPENEIEKAISSARVRLSEKLTELENAGPKKVDEFAAKAEFETILNEFTKIPDAEKYKLLTEYINKFKNSNKDKSLEEKVMDTLEKLFDEFKKGLKNFDFPVDKVRIVAKVGQILDDCKEMTAAEKEKIFNDALKTFEQKVENEYGKALIQAITDISIIEGKIIELSKIEYKDPSFASKHQQLINMIKNYRDSKDFNDAGVEIILDEENQIVTIKFHSDKVNDIAIDIVPLEIKEQMQRKNETPAKPDIEKEKQDAIDNYMRLLEEVKDDILDLNNCNKDVEIAASISFDDITNEKIDNVVSLEDSAMQYEANIMAKKIELSNARANLRMRYNCYVTSLPEVKNYAMPKVEFGKDYNSFVTYYDNMIVIAENKIKELDEKRTAENIPEDKVATLTNEMKKLVKYIEAVNSLINRRIVAASLEEPIDIVALLQKRREDKKKIRKEIKERIERKIASRPKVNQEEAENKLTEELKSIYEEWLRQFKLSLSSETISIDDESFKQKINEVVDQSQADKKYVIAEKLENEYAELREESKTQYEVTSFLTEQILPIMEKIREGAEYEGEKLTELCLNSEIQQKIYEIINNSHATNKKEIFDRTTSHYLDQIKTMIRVEKIAQRREFAKEIEDTLNSIEELEINDDFGSKIAAKFNALKIKYVPTFRIVEINYDIKDNEIKISYTHEIYSKGELNTNTVNSYIEKKLMSSEKHSEYMEYLKNKEKPTQPEPITEVVTQPVEAPTQPEPITEAVTQPVETPTQPEPITEAITQPVEIPTQPEPQRDSKKQGKQLDIIIKDNKGLVFYSNEPQRVTKEPNLIMTADAVELSILKNGLRIKFSEDLRNKLQKLNAKLSLVNKENYRSRTSTQIGLTNADYDDVAFKKKDFEFDPEKYKIQIRTDRHDKDGKKLRGTDVIYETDITEEVSDRLKSGRTL